jgi:hypothetical protein
MYAREPFAGAPGSSGEIGLTLPSGSLLLCSFCSAVNSHRSTAAAARSRHQSTLARDQTYAPLRYIARAHPSIPQGKSSTGILAPAAYNESPIVAFQLAAAKSPLTCFTDPLPEEGFRSAPIANRLWAPRAGPMVRIHFPPAASLVRTRFPRSGWRKLAERVQARLEQQS